jgi:hypothetical protein
MNVIEGNEIIQGIPDGEGNNPNFRKKFSREKSKKKFSGEII